MEITSIEKSKKHGNILSVFVDGQFSLSVPEEDFIKLGLYERQSVTKEEIQRIRNEVIYNRARKKAVNYLQLRLRSVDEVRNKLKSEGYDKETTEKVLSDFQAIGYLNDRLFARKFVYDRNMLKPKSNKMLIHELEAKGVDTKTAQEVVSEWNTDDTLLAERITRKKFGKYDLKDDRILKKIFYFLKHRGFSYETIKEVIAKVSGKDIF